MKLKIALSVLAIAVFGAFTLPETAVFDRDGHKLPDAQVNSPAVNWEFLSINGHRELSGIGLVDIFGGGGCTGTFLDTGAGADGPAYVLSNGHCNSPQLLGHREVAVDRPVIRGMNFRFNYFFDAGPAVYQVPIAKIAYATMHGTDVTLFQLATSFGDLTSKGFVPYRIAAQDPDRPTSVMMVGVPQSGVQRGRRFLRRSVCDLTGRANLREGGYEWFGSFQHQCSSVGGSSGSPMISLQTHELVAINNTGVDDKAVDKPECELDRPCEVAPDGSVRTNFNSNYAQRVTDFASCFDPYGVFNLGLGSCRLERPAK